MKDFRDVIEETNTSSENEAREYKRLVDKKPFKKVLSGLLSGMIMISAGSVAGSYITYKSLENRYQNNEVYAERVFDNNSKKISLSSQKNNQKSIPEIVKGVSPAVVAVSTKSKGGNRSFSPFGFYSEGTREGLGTGVIFDKEGYVLTNYHVIESVVTEKGEVSVILNNGNEALANVVNYDSEYDIAVLKIQGDVEIPGVAVLGESKNLEQGEGVIAIGNPVGKELLGTVTSGIISAINRDIDGRDIKFIQTDAAISPGNSGGPLVNMNGEVVGINTEKRVGEGIEGLGFAIPIDQIKPLLNDLTVPALSIGISGIEVNDELANKYQISKGIYIKEILAYSPAERAGLRVGDVILNIGDEKVNNFSDISEIKKKYKAGDMVKIKVDRNGQIIEMELKFAGLN